MAFDRSAGVAPGGRCGGLRLLGLPRRHKEPALGQGAELDQQVDVAEHGLAEDAEVERFVRHVQGCRRIEHSSTMPYGADRQPAPRPPLPHRVHGAGVPPPAKIKASTVIALADDDAEIGPAPPGDGSRGPELMIDLLSNSDEQNARIEHDRALQRGMTALMSDDTTLFKELWTTMASGVR